MRAYRLGYHRGGQSRALSRKSLVRGMLVRRVSPITYIYNWYGLTLGRGRAGFSLYSITGAEYIRDTYLNWWEGSSLVA